jgi:hypothetical protein
LSTQIHRFEVILGVTTDIGRRIELVPMDPHFHDITIGLYHQATDNGRVFRVHTYSSLPGAQDRIAFVSKAMQASGGMELVEGSSNWLRFGCRNDHILAARRVFLEACKLASTAALEPKGLTIFDKKSNYNIYVVGGENGSYRVESEGGDAARACAVAGGLAKLAELKKPDPSSTQVVFPCGKAHDALIGLLLGRALNVRAALREEEMMAARGTLVAPSAQN